MKETSASHFIPHPSSFILPPSSQAQPLERVSSRVTGRINSLADLVTLHRVISRVIPDARRCAGQKALADERLLNLRDPVRVNPHLKAFAGDIETAGLVSVSAQRPAGRAGVISADFARVVFDHFNAI